MRRQICGATVLSVCAASHTLYAATPVQLDTSDPTNYFFMFDPTVPLASDVDVVLIHDDFYGVPWDAFLSDSPFTSLPLSWELRLNATLEAIIAWDKPVFLGLEMLSGQLRTCPAQNASDLPGYHPSVTAFAGCAQCYDFNVATNPDAADLIKAYALYAAFYTEAILKVAPKGMVGVNFAAEINLGARICPSSWWTDGVVPFSNAVYDIVKDALAQGGSPDVPVFPSIQLEVVLGMQSGPDQACLGMQGLPAPNASVVQCIRDGLALVAPLHRDSFAVSTYPDSLKAGVPAQHAGWQPWYFPAVLGQLSAKDSASFSIAETGYMEADIVVNVANGSVGVGTELHPMRADPPVACMTVLNTSNADANAWLEYIIAQAVAGGWPLVTWWSDKDLLWDTAVSSCPCSTPPEYGSSCRFIEAYRDIEVEEGGPPWFGEIEAKSFATMGLRGLDGTKKPLWATMQEARAARDERQRAAL